MLCIIEINYTAIGDFLVPNSECVVNNIIIERWSAALIELIRVAIK